MEFQITPLDSWINQKIANPAKLTRKALEEYQLEKLRETLDLVRRKSPFYQRHLSTAPSQLTRLSDLAQFPFTTPQDIRDYGLQFLCVSQDEIQRVVTLDTTGTTGQPKRLYFTQEDQDLTLDFFHVGMTTFTEPGDRVLIMLPCERIGSVGDLLATALQRLGAHPIKHGIVRDVSHTLEVMRAEKIDSLVGIPIQTLELACRSRDIRLKSVLLSTDHVPNALARAVERAWGCIVYNHYGMTEMGLGGGVECQARRGYHLREADMLFEIVQPETGLPVADGETGEVVFTTLTRNGMPLIRYRTGDISRFIPGECPCGTSLKTLERVRTRITGMVPMIDGGQLSIADLDEALFSIEGVYDYQATVSHPAERDTLQLNVFAIEDDQTDLQAAIENALDTIPAIHTARANHQLSMQVKIQNDRSIPPLPAKRIIHVEND